MVNESLPMGWASWGREELGRTWKWYLALGVALIVLGTLALGASVMTTAVTVIFLGWLLILGGAMQSIHAVSRREWSGFFLDLLVGILYTVAGAFLILYPMDAAVELTLLMAFLFLFSGVFRIALGIFVPFQHRLWLIINGAITAILGVMIIKQWPQSGLWVIGMFIAIDMIVNGWTLVMLSLTAKQVVKK